MDMIAGQVQLVTGTIPALLPFIKDGRVKPLAVTSARRSPDVPQLPTVAESGLPGFDVGIWYGVLAPAETPPDVTRKLNADIGELVGAEEFRTLMAKQGVTIAPGTREQFSGFYLAEVRKWAKVVKDANIPPMN